MDSFESRLIDVRIDLSGGDTGVAEHLLHLSQVGPACEQVSGETVSQCVRADVTGYPGPGCVFLVAFPDRFTPQPAAPPGKEQPGWRT